jgi:hypothetical protein
VEADLVRRAAPCDETATRQLSGDGEGLAVHGNIGAAFEHAAEALDMRFWPVRESAEGTLSDLAVLAVVLAQRWEGASSGWGRLTRCKW